MPARIRCTLSTAALTGALVACAGLSWAMPPAGDWHCHPWQTDDGLPNNDVTGVIQIADGSMLISTSGGITRLDGLRCRPATTEQGPGTSLVRGMCLTRDGTLWVVKPTQLVGLRKEGPPLVHPLKGTPEGNVFPTVFEARDGTLWLSFDTGPAYCIKAGRISTPPLDGLTAQDFTSVAEDADGVAWTAGRGFLARWHGDRFEKVTDLPSTKIALCAAREGGLWIGAGSELLRHTMETGIVKVATLAVDKPGIRVSKLLEDSSGRLWVGTFASGLHLWTGTEFKGIELTNQDVYSLFEDREGCIWAGTGGGGACCVRRRVVRLFDEPGGPVEQTARSMCVDARGDIWVALHAGVLYARRGGAWALLRGKNDWPASRPGSVTADSKGNTWIGCDGGELVRWDGKSFGVIPVPVRGSGNRIHSLMVAQNGDLWVGCDGHITRGKPGDWRIMDSPGDIGTVLSFAQDAAGRVWAGTADGSLLVADGGRLVRHRPAGLGSSGSIRCLLASPDGGLWIGTANGLAWLKGDRCTLLTTTQGLLHNAVSQLIFDVNGRLWGAGNRGVFVIPPDDLASVCEGRTPRLRCTGHGYDEDLPGLQANSGFTPNALRTPDGNLWFATRSGIVMADPAVLDTAHAPPPAGIEALLVDGTPLPLSSLSAHLRIGPGVSNLVFELGARSFVSPENVSVMHRLDGVDNGWQDSGRERRATYTQLLPGDYLLHARAASGSGPWSAQEATLAFSVLPFWWQSTWFRIVSGLAMLGATGLVVFWVSTMRHRQQTESLRQEAALERERARIARDMHDQIGASLTQISMLSDLAQGDHESPGHLPDLARTAREAITALDGIVWAVNPRHDNLASLLEYTGQQALELLHAAGLRCRVDFPHEVPPLHLAAEFRHHLFLLVREAVNNAVKHSAAHEVRLHAELQPDKLHITIADDGRGFDPALLTNEGNGLANMRHRAQTLGGECTISTRAGVGTIVKFRLPMAHRESKLHPGEP